MWNMFLSSSRASHLKVKKTQKRKQSWPRHLCFLHSCWHVICGCLFLKSGFPGGSVVKNWPANAGDAGSVPGLGRSSEEGNDNPLQYSYLENPMDRGVWWATVHGVAKESNTVWWLNNHFWNSPRLASFFQAMVLNTPHLCLSVSLCLWLSPYLSLSITDCPSPISARDVSNRVRKQIENCQLLKWGNMIILSLSFLLLDREWQTTIWRIPRKLKHQGTVQEALVDRNGGYFAVLLLEIALFGCIGTPSLHKALTTPREAFRCGVWTP